MENATQLGILQQAAAINSGHVSTDVHVGNPLCGRTCDMSPIVEVFRVTLRYASNGVCASPHCGLGGFHNGGLNLSRSAPVVTGWLFSSKASDFLSKSRKSPVPLSTQTGTATSPFPIGMAPVPSLFQSASFQTTLDLRATSIPDGGMLPAAASWLISSMSIKPLIIAK
jgi:hypothetical protein